MAKFIEVKVPDIGDFKGIPVIEILVKPGDEITAETPVVTLESDKATMEVPTPRAGIVRDIRVAVGDKVAEGSLLMILEEASAQASLFPDAPIPISSAPLATAALPESTTPVAPPAPLTEMKPALATAAPTDDLECDVLVLGAGPGGYTAAFRAADLGKKVVLVERYPSLGGVCLNVGCIPSKALLHVAKVITEAAETRECGVDFGTPNIDRSKIRDWKMEVVGKLTKGLTQLAKQRKVTVLQGVGSFSSPHTLSVAGESGNRTVRFAHAIIAAGSQAVKIPGFPYDDPRLMDSTSALDLQEIPERMLVIGGGIIGLEMATVYDALGSKVSVVELGPGLMPGCDRDLVKPLAKRIEKRYDNIWLNTKVAAIESHPEGLKVIFAGDNAPEPKLYHRVLLAVGRSPNGKKINAEAAGVVVDGRGFIAVDKQQRTNVPHIFAIGDIVGNPMLAHKAVHEGKVAAEVIAGHKSYFDALTIPSVAYTDPEVAWMGLTETEAKAQGIAYDKGAFPWAASGRSLSMGRDEGLTKVLVDPQSRRILGAGMVGPNAGELLAEAVLALEMGADTHDLGLTIHPHPTLSETLCFAAEVAEGTITDLFLPKRK